MTDVAVYPGVVAELAGRDPRPDGTADVWWARRQDASDRLAGLLDEVAGLGAVTDYVSVRDLSVAIVIGMHAWEREIEQTLHVSVDMEADVARAAATDDLADALDYSAVAATIAAVLREGRFRLIETAAERVADACSPTSP